MPNGFQLVDQRPEKSHKRTIHENDFVFGVVGYVNNLIREESDVQRV